MIKLNECYVEGDNYGGWFLIREDDTETIIEELVHHHAGLALCARVGSQASLDGIWGLEHKTYRKPLTSPDPLDRSFVSWKLKFRH